MAEELRRRGYTALVPPVEDAGEGPYWERHARSVAGTLPPESSILVGHSGAGMLLPIVRELSGRPAAAYLFVDAGVPAAVSRLDTFPPDDAAAFREFLAGGGHFPEWTEDDLAELVPDDELRRGLVAELRPRGADFWEEPIPLPEGWPDAPCGYLLFSEVYAAEAERARERGWPCRTLDGGHFHMLVEPAAVADALVELLADLR